MTHKPKQFVIIDPRTFDGTPYDVAQRAVAQTLGIVNAANATFEATERMVVNADLERQIIRGETPDPAASVLRRKLHAEQLRLADVARNLEIIRRAAGYDPKNPPTA